MSLEDSIGPGTVVIRSEEPIAVEVDRTIVMMSLAQGMYFGLEGAGPRIWELLERPRSVAELSEALVEQFEVDAATCLRDTCEFLETLRQAQLIRVHDAAAGSIRPSEPS